MARLSFRIGLFLALALPLGIFSLGSVRGQFNRAGGGLQPPILQPPKIPQNPNIPVFDDKIRYRCRRCGWTTEQNMMAPPPACPICSRNGGAGVFQQFGQNNGALFGDPFTSINNARTAGSIAGMVAGGVLFLALVIAVIWAVVKKRRPEWARERRRRYDDDLD